LITGGTGFIGLSLIYVINILNISLNTNISVDVLARRKINFKNKLYFKINTNINFIKHDLSQNKIKINKNYDCIIHLANNPNANENNSKTIIACDENLINSFKNNVNKPSFILLSSGAIYDDKNNYPLKEGSKKMSLKNKNITEYSRGKLASEKFLKINKSNFSKIIIFRGFTFIGFLKKFDNKFLINQIINKIVKNSKVDIKINTDGSISRSFLYTIDAAIMIIMSIYKIKKGVFNLGSDEIFTIKKLDRKINMDSKNNIKFLYLNKLKKPYSRNFYIPDISYLKNKLDYKTIVKLSKSISLVANNYKN